MRGAKRSSPKWNQQHLDRTQRVLQAWTTRDPAATKTEAAGLRQAIADADWDTIERHGGVDAVVDKINQGTRKRWPRPEQE